MQNNKGKKEEEKSKKKLSAGEIAGIVIGSVAALALIIVLIVMLIKKKKTTSKALSAERASPNNLANVSGPIWQGGNRWETNRPPSQDLDVNKIYVMKNGKWEEQVIDGKKLAEEVLLEERISSQMDSGLKGGSCWEECDDNPYQYGINEQGEPKYSPDGEFTGNNYQTCESACVKWYILHGLSDDYFWHSGAAE